VDCRIQKLSLQPLVENALYHGIEKKRGGGTIRVCADVKDGCLVYDGTPTELFGGAHDVEEWGLRRPTAAALAGRFGFTAATPEEFCSKLQRKGAEG
jgi:hypothetical protein